MASHWKIPHLPDDIVESILLELPVKSLLRFKSSCKSWCCSINDPDFIKSHLHKSSTDISRQKVLFVTFEKFSPFTILSNDKIGSAEASLTVDSKVMLLDPPIQGFLNDVSANLKVSSCNGLVFIKNDTSMMLWNPAIQKYKLIPSYNMPLLFWTYSLFGIAYDSLAEDYKIGRRSREEHTALICVASASVDWKQIGCRSRAEHTALIRVAYASAEWQQIDHRSG
ncbi:putative F-box protein At3g17480 [Capsicum annuum]|uniref:putative F-box protein At3g17480 n=1 Tax=Capsicum annuum TaxID=4072 RepID=UPI001FB0EFFE|nr:putative F-box protein At3g17480 [Capsicum annuum]